MLSLSYGRLLGTRSVFVGLVTLAILLAVVATPAFGANTTASSGHRSRSIDPSLDPSVVRNLPNFTPWFADTTFDTGAVTRSPRGRGGYVVTEDQLANEQDFSLGSVLIAHFPGIRVIHGTDVDRVASGLNLDMIGSPCFLQVFVDGVYIENGGVDWVNVRDLATIEYRTPGNVPVQYQNRLPGAMCGVLFLWSKYS
ncbi:MAG: hypothetical protein ABI035_07245 [Gemmatimonadaceae bacterium]